MKQKTGKTLPELAALKAREELNDNTLYNRTESEFTQKSENWSNGKKDYTNEFPVKRVTEKHRRRRKTGVIGFMK